MKNILILLSFAFSFVLTAQVGIGTNTPHSSASLEISSVNKGFLAPRVALTSNSDVSTITTPATGLMIYNTASAGTSPNAVLPGYYYFNGLKWERLVVTAADATVDFSTANPNTGSPIFTPNMPSSAHYIYVSSVDASQWVWNGTAYVTYVAPVSSAWNLANSNNDAGNNKNSSIWRNGNIGIGVNNALSTLHVNNPLAATNTVNADAQVLRLSRRIGTGVKWDNIAQFNIGSYGTTQMNAQTRLDLALTNVDNNTATTNIMSWLANGNVGIGTVAPTNNLNVIGGVDIRSTAGASGSGFGIEFNTNGSSPRIDWVYNGSYSGSFASDSDFFFRLQNSRVGAGFRFLTNPGTGGVERLTILNNGNIGVNNITPTSRFEVNGAITNTSALNAVATTNINFSMSNLAYTTANPGAFVLSNIKDGGCYTLAVRGTTAGTATFTATGFTFRSVSNGITDSNSHTLYKFTVIGSVVYVEMIKGL